MKIISKNFMYFKYEKITFIAETLLNLAGLFISQSKTNLKVKERIKWMNKARNV